MEQRFLKRGAWCVYIMSNNTHTLYVGATSDLITRIADHRTKRYKTSFTARYTFDRCVYFEFADSQPAALRRERQIKAWSRAKKVKLIQSKNPNWIDLTPSATRALMLV